MHHVRRLPKDSILMQRALNNVFSLLQLLRLLLLQAL